MARALLPSGHGTSKPERSARPRRPHRAPWGRHDVRQLADGGAQLPSSEKTPRSSRPTRGRGPPGARPGRSSQSNRRHHAPLHVKTALALALTGTLAAGCSPWAPCPMGRARRARQASGGPALERVSAQDAARLRRVIEPLAKAADHPPKQVTVGILSDKSINAANAGNGEFYVTRGLLDRANDEQLRAIMAHEIRAQRPRARREGAAAPGRRRGRVGDHRAGHPQRGDHHAHRGHPDHAQVQPQRGARGRQARGDAAPARRLLEGSDGQYADLAGRHRGRRRRRRLVRDASRHERPDPGAAADAVTPR